MPLQTHYAPCNKVKVVYKPQILHGHLCVNPVHVYLRMKTSVKSKIPHGK